MPWTVKPSGRLVAAGSSRDDSTLNNSQQVAITMVPPSSAGHSRPHPFVGREAFRVGLRLGAGFRFATLLLCVFFATINCYGCSYKNGHGYIRFLNKMATVLYGF